MDEPDKMDTTGRPVITVAAKSIPVGDERFPEHCFVMDFWNRLRGDRVGPSRSDLDPRGLKPVLPRITLIEKDAARGGFRFRLAGTDLFDLQSREISDRNTGDMWPTEYAELLNAHYRKIFETARPNSFEIVFRTHEGKEGYYATSRERSYATLRVPLSDEGETVDGIMSIDTFCERWKDPQPYFEPPNDG